MLDSNFSSQLVGFLSMHDAIALGIYSKQHLYRLIAQNKIAAVRYAGRLFLSQSALIEYKISPKDRGGRPHK